MDPYRNDDLRVGLEHASDEDLRPENDKEKNEELERVSAHMQESGQLLPQGEVGTKDTSRPTYADTERSPVAQRLCCFLNADMSAGSSLGDISLSRYNPRQPFSSAR